MIALSSGQMACVRDVLARVLPGRDIRVFGSRARGDSKPYSDLDLVVMGDAPLSLSEHALLGEAFEESELPFRVDVVDWAGLGSAFREAIARDAVPLDETT